MSAATQGHTHGEGDMPERGEGARQQAGGRNSLDGARAVEHGADVVHSVAVEVAHEGQGGAVVEVE